MISPAANEKAFEDTIAAALLDHGYVQRIHPDHDRVLCLDAGPLFDFVLATDFVTEEAGQGRRRGQLHAQGVVQWVGPESISSTYPALLIDDLVLTWAELGEILMTYEGWGLRLQITSE